VLMTAFYTPLFTDSPEATLLELKSMIIGEKLNADQKMYSGVVDNTGPLASWINEIADSGFGRSLLPRHIISFLLLFIQAALWSIILISRKAFTENTYVPSFLFGILTFISYDMLAFSGELFGLTFLMFALNNLFVEIEFRVQRDEITFNLGLFIGIASLFSFGYIIFLFCVLSSLFLFTRSSPRKFLLVIFGFLLPHLLFCSISYLRDALTDVWQYFYVSNLAFARQTFVSNGTLLTLMALPVFYFVLSLFMLQREARFSKYQSQLLQVMFLWIGFSVLYLLYCKNLRPQHLIVFIPALAFLFSHFFLLIRRKRYAEINFWILIIGVLSIGYLTRYNKFSSVDYSKLVVSNLSDIGVPSDKKILVLENNLAYFKNNRLATPYLNWSLAEKTFRNPQYYENVTRVYHWLRTDTPQVIIDRENLMFPFLERMPEIKKEYLRSGNVYQLRKPSN
jgi:hypothetical protein